VSKVLFLGIDGLDRGLVERYRERMPHLWSLAARGQLLELRSVLPPDSNTAWATIYTGWNPARHGLVHFVDPLRRIQIINEQEVGAGAVEGRSFWDHACRAGRRVTLVLPHLGYPVWPVGGTMIGRSTIADDVQCYPQGLLSPAELEGLNTIKGFPPRGELESWLARVRALVDREAEVGLRRLREDTWDLFLWYSSALDLVMHFCWRFADPADPSYPGPNPYEGVIADLHAQYDDVLGRLIGAAPGDATVVLCSDHGHGMRPTRLLHINELLRREGLLVTAGGDGRSSLRAAAAGSLERGKRLALDLVSRHNLGPWASRALRLLPAARRLFTHPLKIDWARTLAYATDLSGIKAYAYGGVLLRREGLSPAAYEEVRQQVITALRAVTDPETGQPIAQLVCRREDLYHGEHLERYPDIVFYLRDGWGAGWDAGGELFGEGAGHSLVPGSHKLETAVLVIAPAEGWRVLPARAELVDIAPTVLQLLGVPAEGLGLEGRSLVEAVGR